jgi:hypothetical protein
MVTCISYKVSTNRRISVHISLGINPKPYLKKNTTKKKKRKKERKKKNHSGKKKKELVMWYSVCLANMGL